MVGMSEGTVFAGGPREIMVSADHLNWYHWSCPLSEVVGLHVDDGLLVVVGDDQLAVSEVRHKGKLWQVVEVEGATCVHIARRVFVGTSDGRMFEFEIKRKRGLLARFSTVSPAIVPAGEWKLASPLSATAYHGDGYTADNLVGQNAGDR